MKKGSDNMKKLIAVLCAFGMCAGLITPQLIYAEEPAAAPAEKRGEKSGVNFVSPA